MRSRLSRVAVLVVVLWVGASALAIPTHLGVSFTPWERDVTDPTPGGVGDLFLGSADEMVYTGVTWVALNAWEFQDTLFSTTIAPDYTSYSTPDDSLARVVQELHSRGIKVLLKPMVDVKTGQWRGLIPPSAGWFNEYGDFITRWAVKADAWGVDALSIGCEFRTVIQSTPAVALRAAVGDMVTAVRGVGFTGPLTYSANHDSYEDVPFWDLMDYIGIDAYFRLTTERDPTPAELGLAWSGHADDIEDWWLNTLTEAERKKVLFTEIGYTNWDGTNTMPNQWGPFYYDGNGDPVTDPAEQAACYQAAMVETWEREWMDGYFWWIWDPEPGGADWNPFSPQMNAPTMVVLRRAYIPEPTCLVLVGAGLLALLRRRGKSAL